MLGEESRVAAIRGIVEEWPIAAEFDAMLAGNGISSKTRIQYAYAIRLLAEWTDGKGFDELDRSDIIGVGARLEEEYASTTAALRRTLISSFLQYVHGLEKGEYPSCLDPWKRGVHRPSRKSRIPKGIISPGQVLELLQCLGAQRDRAFFHCLYESGARIGEFLGMAIRDVLPEEHTVILGRRGRGAKTGGRPVRVYSCVPDLKEWLSSHPERQDGDAPLWISSRGRALSMATVQHHLSRAKYAFLERYGRSLPKDFSLHSFRHSRATELAKELTEAQLRMVFGWSASSTMPATYVHITQADLADKMDRIHGLRPPEDAPSHVLATVTCPRCGFESSADADYCSRCAGPLSVGARRAVRMGEERFEAIEAALRGMGVRL